MELFDGQSRLRGPYGTNEGDIWAMGGEVGEMLEEKGMLGINEMLRKDGKLDVRIYSVKLDNPDPDIQDLIKRARAGVELWVEAQAALN